MISLCYICCHRIYCDTIKCFWSNCSLSTRNIRRPDYYPYNGESTPSKSSRWNIAQANCGHRHNGKVHACLSRQQCKPKNQLNVWKLKELPCGVPAISFTVQIPTANQATTAEQNWYYLQHHKGNVFETKHLCALHKVSTNGRSILLVQTCWPFHHVTPRIETLYLCRI